MSYVTLLIVENVTCDMIDGTMVVVTDIYFGYKMVLA